MTKVKKLTIESHHRELLSWFLITVIVSLFGVYAYLVNTSVFNILNRTESYEKINLLSNELSHLEAKYLTLAGGITLEQARALGFDDASQRTKFVNRTQTAALLTLPANEI
jgi:hypothetical protein